MKRVGHSSSMWGPSGTTIPADFLELGPDTGFDSMGDFNMARSMSRFLDHLDEQNQLAKTIVYNLNPVTMR